MVSLLCLPINYLLGYKLPRESIYSDERRDFFVKTKCAVTTWATISVDEYVTCCTVRASPPCTTETAGNINLSAVQSLVG